MDLQMLVPGNRNRLGNTKVELVYPGSTRTVSFCSLAAVSGEILVVGDEREELVVARIFGRNQFSIRVDKQDCQVLIRNVN